MRLRAGLRPQLVAVALFALWSFDARAVEAIDRSSVAGTYEYVGGATQIQAMYAAVETVVQKMSVFIRSIARRKIRKPNMPSAELTIVVDQTQIRVVRSGSTVSAPSDGKAAPWRGPNGTFSVSYALEGRTLLQTMNGKSSHTTNRYVLSDDGVTLSVQTKIESHRLPAPVTFEMSYRKK